MEKLVSDILDISKLEAGEMKFEMEETSLRNIVQAAKEDLILLAKNKGLKLTFNMLLKPPIIYADQKRLMQVLENLIRNAIKFTDKGSIIINVQLSDDKRSVTVSVKDTGHGIKEKDIPELFSKFFQAEQAATRKSKGTGLGLAISKQIIKAHQGRIWAESVIGKGSTFYFTLPVKGISKEEVPIKED